MLRYFCVSTIDIVSDGLNSAHLAYKIEVRGMGKTTQESLPRGAHHERPIRITNGLAYPPNYLYGWRRLVIAFGCRREHLPKSWVRKDSSLVKALFLDLKLGVVYILNAICIVSLEVNCADPSSKNRSQ